MSVFQGDFLGFTLGEIHSSQLNITRVSSGDRYTDILLPSFKDITAEAPGGDGMYYWNTFYTQKPFTLDFAYDDLRDEDLRALRKLFSFKGVQPLIFDELPYKKYMVKCVAPPTFKYICFDYMEMRLYKGEGSINLMAYYPYALATSPIKVTKANSISINNNGDLDANLKIYSKFSSTATAMAASTIVLTNNKGNQVGKLCLKKILRQDGDAAILIDNTTHLIEGVDNNFNKTGHLYNSFIDSGDFFNVPVGQHTLDWTYQSSGTTVHKQITVECTPLYY